MRFVCTVSVFFVGGHTHTVQMSVLTFRKEYECVCIVCGLGVGMASFFPNVCNFPKDVSVLNHTQCVIKMWQLARLQKLIRGEGYLILSGWGE